LLNQHVVLGSGLVGSLLAKLRAESGSQVIIASRSGKGPEHKNIVCAKANASSFIDLYSLSDKPKVIYNCVNPPYHKWKTEWPPISNSLNEYAEKTQAVLVTCSNLYGYGPHGDVLTEDLHDSKKIRATEVRGSDYIAASDQSRMGDRVVPNLVKGKKIQLLGAIDQLHTWTDPEDVARLMIVVGQDEKAWGKPWHVPSNEPKTQLQVVQDISNALGVPVPNVSSVPLVMQKLIGIFNPVVKELLNSNYQFDGPFIMSDTKTRNTFGLTPKKWDKVIDDLFSAYKN
jgi:nucleoside-diphosphate-sugar epimerase